MPPAAGRSSWVSRPVPRARHAVVCRGAYIQHDARAQESSSVHVGRDAPPCSPEPGASTQNAPNYTLLPGAMDDQLLEALLAAGIPAFAMSSGLTTKDFGWGTPTFFKMVGK